MFPVVPSTTNLDVERLMFRLNMLRNIRFQLMQMYELAEKHRQQYDAMADAAETEMVKEYWKGRRDEAGWMRDTVGEVLNGR